jgi:response regulator RpfG family c-di-GMP phosphodiesterase
VPTDEVVRMIVDETGTRFDPSVVEVFLGAREPVESIQAEYLD